ncbi:hypothetical protein [Methylobacterium sp. E-066]|uniref:hypothetical protein n=1 Tax=Methylobacterium sp. E-066 TaxID=2836584 RepID=UPI001FB942D1|nr:hypothetical protein [Methylobacterium sp. E-066]MCJ2143734.1 hypothetical protein [Methylobacterium sp. E-066]
MSLMRTALRLQAIEALNSDPVIDAMVQGRVYDSRIANFDHREPVPTILLTSEETKGEAWSHQNGGAPFGLSCDLVLEIAMNAVAQVSVEGQDPFEAIGYAATDRELEAELDLLEERAIDILTRGETGSAQLLRGAVIKRVPTVACSRFATDQTGEKFAVHLVTLRIELFTPEDADPFAVPTGPYALLPEPLRTIAAASDPDGSVRSTCDLLVRRLSPLPAPSEPAPFSGANMILAPQVLDAKDAPDRAADIAAGRTIAIAANAPQ